MKTSYAGFLESKIGHLIRILERNTCIDMAHVNPKQYKPLATAKLECQYENPVSTIWFIGLQFSGTAKNLDLTNEIVQFKNLLGSAAATAKGIGRSADVAVDLQYVERSDLHHFVAGQELRRGRALQKANGTSRSPSTTGTPSPPHVNGGSTPTSDENTPPAPMTMQLTRKRQPSWAQEGKVGKMPKIDARSDGTAAQRKFKVLNY